MLRGINRLAADMTARITRQDMLAENLANSQTPGYKAQRLFMTLLEEEYSKGGKVASERKYGVYTDFSQGVVDRTHRPLDFAIAGEGFFAVETSQGERYTRAGNFTLTEEGVLATNKGDIVMGTSGPITIEGGDFNVSAEGKVIVNGAEIGAIKVVVFDDPGGLVRQGNYYMAAGQSPTESEMIDTHILQGALERSNVSPIDEMVDMVAMYRGFESDQASLKLQDESARKLIENANM